jgi:hypothetical protein
MVPPFTPSRYYGAEHLDDPALSDDLLIRSLADVARSNSLFRGTAAAVAEVTPFFKHLPSHATLLDIGTGMGDIPWHVQRHAAHRGISLRTIGVDLSPALAKCAETYVSHAVCASALALPFASKSVDIVMCSQVLHHFRGDAATTLVREMNRVARVGSVISDLRRSWIAAGGFWLASFPLRFHRITRHDGVVSVMRGFTTRELADTVRSALGVTPRVQSRLGFRVTTSWQPV